MSEILTRVAREERIDLRPYSLRAHYGHIQDALIEMSDGEFRHALGQKKE